MSSAIEIKQITLERLQIVGRSFDLGGEVVAGGPHGNGHINDTFAVRVRLDGGGARRFIFQRINDTVFQDVAGLMENIARVTTHVRNRLADMPGADPDRETLTVIPTREGADFLTTGDGEYWRAYFFIEGASSHDVVRHPGQARAAAKAFGRFQNLLADFRGESLTEIIPGFHDTPGRLRKLQQAAGVDTCNRLENCGPEVDFSLSLDDRVNEITQPLKDGLLPKRVSHNDTKLNNVMIDNSTGEGVCVIDLDTVMPGSALFDFGDLVRSSTGHFAEDSRDLSEVWLDLDRFRAVTEGFLSTARHLNREERSRLSTGAILMTYEVGIRFLTDYLEGDVYFKTEEADDNLVRARTQLAFVKEMLNHESDMIRIIREMGDSP